MNFQPEPLTIRSGQGDYRVDFPPDFAGLLAQLEGFVNAVVLIDENVATIYGEALAPLLARLPHFKIRSDEEAKTMAGVQSLLDFFQQHNATKQTVLIAIGGGVIQDIATFAAHIYYRGLRWVYVPTTLLGMCDSCIGAKCGINLNAFKNQIGVFHSPHRVLICLPFLETLSDVEIVSGYGEILKLLITGSVEQFEFLRTSVENGGLRNPHLSRLIYESLKVKKGVIEKDEYELDLRRILNYGHTFGHALEAITHHGIPHGKAVAWGIDLVNFIAVERGLLKPDEYDLIHGFIRKHFAHRIAQAVSARDLIDASRRDKKVADGKVNLILLRRCGDLQIVPTIFDARLEDEVQRYLAQKDVLSWD